MQKTVVKKEIKAPAVFRVYDKQGKFIGYAVPSDQGGPVPYLVTYNRETGRYACQCKDHQERNHDCKHINAAIAVAIARREFHKQPVSTPVAPLASYDVVGESLKVVNQAVMDAKIGTFYEDVVAGEVKISNVCGHLVRHDVNSHCGCMA